MDVLVPVYEQREGRWITWTTLGLGPYSEDESSTSTTRLRDELTKRLKAVIRRAKREDLDLFQATPGIKLVRLRLQLKLRGETTGTRRVSGRYPLIIEPRPTDASGDNVLRVAYHPLRQSEWFPLDEGSDLSTEQQAALYFQHVWAEIDDDDLDDLMVKDRDRLTSFAFTGPHDRLVPPRKKGGVFDDLTADPVRQATEAAKKKKSKRPKAYEVLDDLGVDQTPLAVDGMLNLGRPRSPWRQQLQLSLCGRDKRSVLLVGPPGVGKSTLINRWIADLLEADDYASHNNLDKVHHVWRLSGQRIIAGMSYVGDWEERCVKLLGDVEGRQIVLWFEDLAAFGRIGQTRSSDRSLAEFFRGPIARGELIVVGECTPAELARLEDDAPSLVAALTVLHVHPPERGEVLSMCLTAARALEPAYNAQFTPDLYGPLIELTDALYPGAAFPGKALDQLERLARTQGGDSTMSVLAPAHLLRDLADRTGLPRTLLFREQPLDPETVRADLGQHVIGQPQAVDHAVDLILRIRAGLTDPGRPYGVYLFTGPTGTGKTELAKTLAAWLYSSAERLVRLDMSEYATPDAASRLIGDRWQPDGTLTRPVIDQPFSAVLLDEIEKAHPSVLNLLLQLFDEGRLTDAAGRTADYRHTIVMMTSNLGARTSAPVGFGEESDAARAHDALKAVKDFFPPELYNRMDRVIAFSRLDHESARLISKKALEQLLARRGLVEREVFVHATSKVLDRAVREGFTASGGARTVKRWLEERVGGLFVEHLARGTRAEMQVHHLYDADEGLALHAEVLEEAHPRAMRWSLEGLLEAPASELAEYLPAAMDTLEDLQGSEALRELAERMGEELAEQRASGSFTGPEAERIYWIDKLRGALDHLRRHCGWLYKRRGGDRIAILEALAKVPFLERAAATVGDLGRHTIDIEVAPIGERRRGDRFQQRPLVLLPALHDAYKAGYGEVEAAWFSARGGVTDKPVSDPSVIRTLVRKSGLNILDYFEGETGCHVWESVRFGTAVARVEVRSASDEAPGRVLEGRRAQRQAFEDALEAGTEPLPENPRRLLPVVRRLGFDPPTTSGALAEIEVEDYLLGHAEVTRARSLGDVLPKLWRLRQSRTGGGP